ncbi:MAG: outer membrane beta-barrel protein [Elusimicrobia bacterium]|nr:outer membrane beta-barrel protein [Elusimicrobiota bacterium]
MKRTIVILLVILGSFAAPLAGISLAEEPESVVDEIAAEKINSKTGKMLIFSGGGGAGENFLVDGYKKYKNNLSAKIELRIGLANAGARPNMFVTMNYDYMPLIMPAGLYGMSEKITSFNAGFLYGFDAQNKINLFIGPGAGFYYDLITLDTPASGKLEHEYSFFGYNITAGFNYYVAENLVLIPEIRYHLIREPGSFYATNMIFQIGAQYNFARMDWNKWKRNY